MITCKSCGKPVQAGLANCQNCGMPLSGPDQERMGPGMGMQERSELPAWLESLRVQERPGSTANEQPYFSPADLIDEGALPGWMRPENAELLEKSNTGKYPAWRPPATAPAPNTDEGILPQKGFSAHSLLDEQSLPSWVHGNQAASRATFDASEIQPGKPPDWVNPLSQSPQPPAPHNVWGGGESFRDSQVGINSFAPGPMGGDPTPPSRGFSPQDLIDQQALPQWMTGQVSQPGQQAGFPTAAPQGGQARLAASSLLDMNSLPNWLRENEHTQGHSGQPGQIPGENGGLSGSTLIDENALPDWLRSADAQQQAGMPPVGNARPPASYDAAPRVESVRVPSRPRGEMMPHEQSEVAANVFSSMLGVASGAPNIPAPGAQWNAPNQPPGFGGVSPAQGYNLAGDYPMGAQPGTRQPRQRSNINSPGAKPAKRGIIETIRSWFS